LAGLSECEVVIVAGVIGGSYFRHIERANKCQFLAQGHGHCYPLIELGVLLAVRVCSYPLL